MRQDLAVLGMAAALLLSWPMSAAAYLDPVSGSVAFQILMGGMLTAAAALRLYWRRIRGLWGRRTRDTPETESLPPSSRG